MSYQHVLAAVDMSQHSQLVIASATDVARRCDAKLSLLHVIQGQLTLVEQENYFSHQVIGAEMEVEEKIRQAMLSLVPNDLINVQQASVLSGSVKHEVSQFVQDNTIDLLVIGTHGHHGIGNLMGSQANALLHVATCDVLAVRATDDE